MSGSTCNNSGDSRGAVIIQDSTVDNRGGQIAGTINNAGQLAGTMASADAASRDELQALLKQLGEALKPVPPEHVEGADATAAAAEDLVKEAAKDKSNKSRLRSLGDALVATAKVVGAAAPAALSIADKVVSLIGKIHGLG